MKPLRLLWLICSILTYCLNFRTAHAVKIGIVGAGIGGTSAAYFLRDLSDQIQSSNGQKLEIDIFEKSSKSGGRLALVDIDGQNYEAGGSVIHPKNFYMNLFVDKLGLKKRSASNNGPFGTFDGQNLIFEQSSFPIITKLKMLFKYGLDPYFLQKNINNFTETFEQIYHLQNEKKKSFKTVKSLLENINPEFWRQMDAATFNETLLTEWGLHQKLADEIIEPIIRVNYGQGLNVHGFVGSVAIAGADPDLWAISGGNRLVTERLLEASKAKVHFNHMVTSIAKNNNNQKFTINCQNVQTKFESSFNNYDYVIVATPFTEESNLKFDPELLAGSMKKWPSYHKLHVYFIRGNLRSEFSHLTSIFSCFEYQNLNSVGLIHPVNSSSSSSATEPNLHIWKVFSNDKIDTNQPNNAIKRFFDDNFVVVDQVQWLAYPQYETPDHKVSKKEEFRFEIADGIFYINAVESAASAMEISAVGAKNVAMLIGDKIFGLIPN